MSSDSLPLGMMVHNTSSSSLIRIFVGYCSVTALLRSRYSGKRPHKTIAFSIFSEIIVEKQSVLPARVFVFIFSLACQAGKFHNKKSRAPQEKNQVWNLFPNCFSTKSEDRSMSKISHQGFPAYPRMHRSKLYMQTI
jgi:hypothetical protein